MTEGGDLDDHLDPELDARVVDSRAGGSPTALSWGVFLVHVGSAVLLAALLWQGDRGPTGTALLGFVAAAMVAVGWFAKRVVERRGE